MTDRYAGQPLVRLLECYVLRAIDELDESNRVSLEEMTPKLREVYRLQGSWYEIIESVMEFPAGMAEKISEMWDNNKQLALTRGENLLPQHFAEMFVDQNLR